jgi:glycosyltransferase involved in cell wall biosynthesis
VVKTTVKAAVFAVPGDLATPTGGYAYDRRMIAELAALGWRTDVLNLGEGFPRPTADTRAAACAHLAALPSAAPIVIDGLAFGVLPEAAKKMQASHLLVALVHHPLALESGLSADEAAGLHVSERVALAAARRVVTTSAATARLLTADYCIASERLSVVEPGTDRGDARPRKNDAAVALLAVGAVVERKGYDLLVAALAKLKHLSWRLVIAGDHGRSPEAFRRLEADIAWFGLADRITLLGAVSAQQLASLYATSDLFVLPSRFEGYGMAFAEAIAHGLPVIGTTAGAIPQTVPAGAGILVRPDDVDALASALRQLIENPHERERLAAGARAATFPSWKEQAALFAGVLDRLA